MSGSSGGIVAGPTGDDSVPVYLMRGEQFWVPPRFTCPRCGMTSYNEHDIREGYCGNCHDWTGRPTPPR